MDVLNQLVKSERVAKNDWVNKFKSTEKTLSERQKKVMSLEQILKDTRNENNNLNIKLEAQMKTLRKERAEREEFESQLKETIDQLQRKESELSDLVQVSRQLEQQRYRQYKSADEEILKI